MIEEVVSEYKLWMFSMYKETTLSNTQILKVDNCTFFSLFNWTILFFWTRTIKLCKRLGAN